MTDEPGRDRSEDADEREVVGSEELDGGHLDHHDIGESDASAADPDARPSFSTTFRGYNTDEVDSYLVELLERDEVRAERLERLQAELDAVLARGTADVDAERARFQTELDAERARHQTERAQLDNVRASLEARVVALEHELERLRGELDATRGALPEIESLRSRLETLTETYEQRVSALDALVPYLADRAQGEAPQPEQASEPEREQPTEPEQPAEPEQPGVPEPDDAPADVWRGDWERAPDADEAEPSGGGSREDLDDAIGWEPGANLGEEDEDPSGEDSGPSTTR